MGRFTKNLSEEEERIILSRSFTSPFADISFVIPSEEFGPEEQATLAAKFSRSDKPYQAKFLESLDKNPAMARDLVQRIKENGRVKEGPSIGAALKSESARFHTDWSLGISYTSEERDEAIRSYGDGSIKDGANVLYHAENITDLDGKNVTQNPKDRPQVVSTRYIDRTKVLKRAEDNPDIKGSKHADQILETIRLLSDAYVNFTDRCTDYIEKHPTNQAFREFWLTPESIEEGVVEWKKKELRKDPERVFSDKDLEEKKAKIYKEREEGYPKYARKTVFDFTRYLLFPAITTSMAVASDARTLEEDLTTLLSSPLITARNLGENLLVEGRKVLPTLLGKNTHAGRNDFLIGLRQELTDFVMSRVEDERTKSYEITSRTNFVDHVIPSYNDAQLAASLVFPYSHCSIKQLYNHFAKNPTDITHVVDTVLRLRGRFDADPLELLHGGLMRETLIDYGGDRDLQRHRRGTKSKQLLSTYHGAETPDLFFEMGLQDEFQFLMQKVDKTYRRIVDDGCDPNVAQLMVPFAFRFRRLYSWQFGQDLFVSELRSRDGAISSYKRVALDIAREDTQRMPEFGRLFRTHHEDYPAHLINLKDAKAWYNSKRSSTILK